MKALKHYWSNYWFLPAFSFIVCLLTFLLRVEYAYYVLVFFVAINISVFVGSWISFRKKVKNGILHAAVVEFIKFYNQNRKAMKITVYCDHNGILRYNPDGWPEKPSDPGEWAHQEFHREYYEEKAKWRKDIEKAKSESVPFEDSDGFLRGLCGEVVADSFYDVEIDGVIEIHSLGCDCELERAKGTVCLCFMCIPFQQRKQLAFIVKNELSGNSEQLT